MILKADTKKIIITKSKYEQVNNIMIDSYLDRINDNYDVIILHKENTIELQITLKSSIGRA